MMTLQFTQGDNGDRMVWNDSVLDSAESDLFEPDWWRSRDALLGEAQGRGAAYFLHGLDGKEWVLRHNRRGGVIARFNHDRFLYIGAERARPIRELRLIATLEALDLPVPRPIAARVAPRLGFYCGDVITQRIEQAEPLADRLANQALPSMAWQRLGAVLARFHRAGLWHADLNARNVLVDLPEASVYAAMEADLDTRDLDAALDVALKLGDEGEEGASAGFTIGFKGPLAAPDRTLDLTEIDNYLALRAVERERERVERLQADILEKQRLRREAALYQGREEAREHSNGNDIA